jgi:hypothetical protein
MMHCGTLVFSKHFFTMHPLVVGYSGSLVYIMGHFTHEPRAVTMTL